MNKAFKDWKSIDDASVKEQIEYKDESYIGNDYLFLFAMLVSARLCSMTVDIYEDHWIYMYTSWWVTMFYWNILMWGLQIAKNQERQLPKDLPKSLTKIRQDNNLAKDHALKSDALLVI